MLRKIDKCIDLSFVRELTEPFYCQNNGRPSIDPELFFRMIIIGYLYGIESDRRLCEEIQYNLAYRWFCKLNLEDKVADHSSLTRIRERLELNSFNDFFIKIVEQCKEFGLVKGERVMTDGTLFQAEVRPHPCKKGSNLLSNYHIQFQTLLFAYLAETFRTG